MPEGSGQKLTFRQKRALAVELDCDYNTLLKRIAGTPTRNQRAQEIRIDLVRRGLAENVTDEERIAAKVGAAS